MRNSKTPVWILVLTCLATGLLFGQALAQETGTTAGAPVRWEDSYDSRRFIRHRTGAETCLLCHGHYNVIVKRDDTPRHSLWIDSGMYYQSIHAKEGCQSCHTNIDEHGHRMVGYEQMPTSCSPCHDAAEPGSEPTAMVAPAGNGADPAGNGVDLAGFEMMLTETDFSPLGITTLQACCNCHEDEFKVWAESVHGQSVLTDPDSLAPTCIDCHGAHGVLPATDERSITHPANIPATCLACHDQVELKARAGLERDIAGSFNESFHGRRGEMGSDAVAVCTTCHGDHGIFAPVDPRSKVNKTRIAKTCGECHEGAQLNFASAFTHQVVSPTEQLGLYILKQIYKWVIFLLIAQFVLFAGLDIFQTYRHKLKKRRASHNG